MAREHAPWCAGNLQPLQSYAIEVNKTAQSTELEKTSVCTHSGMQDCQALLGPPAVRVQLSGEVAHPLGCTP